MPGLINEKAVWPFLETTSPSWRREHCVLFYTLQTLLKLADGSHFHPVVEPVQNQHPLCFHLTIRPTPCWPHTCTGGCSAFHSDSEPWHQEDIQVFQGLIHFFLCNWESSNESDTTIISKKNCTVLYSTNKVNNLWIIFSVFSMLAASWTQKVKRVSNTVVRVLVH